MLVLCQQFVQKAKKLIRHCGMISDEPVVLLDLLLALRIKKKPLLSLLSIKRPSGSEEGSGDQQMTRSVFS
jgi:hypothetical protein